jgi:alpha-tubulin suppressor-like RCC1 family protein
VALAGGHSHTIAVKRNGTLWAWGRNNVGQLGVNPFTDQLLPTQVGTDSDWAVPTAAYLHSAAIKRDGSLWAWGFNTAGQIGDGTTSVRPFPTAVGTAGWVWETIAAANAHNIAVRNDGTLWTWGSNLYGQLGYGSTSATNTAPAQVGSDSDWVAVGAGSFHVAATKSDTTLWAWGRNQFGQLGNGTTTDNWVPAQWGRPGTRFGWVGVVGLGSHMSALRTDGSLWGAGQNTSGELGDGTWVAQWFPERVLP